MFFALLLRGLVYDERILILIDTCSCLGWLPQLRRLFFVTFNYFFCLFILVLEIDTRYGDIKFSNKKI